VLIGNIHEIELSERSPYLQRLEFVALVYLSNKTAMQRLNPDDTMLKKAFLLSRIHLLMSPAPAWHSYSYHLSLTQPVCVLLYLYVICIVPNVTLCPIFITFLYTGSRIEWARDRGHHDRVHIHPLHSIF